MTLLQPAKFFAGAGGHTEPTQFADKYGSPHSSQPVITPAVFEVNGVRLLSKTPESAAEAEDINQKLKEAALP